MKQLHPIQLNILKKLLFAETLRYSELKPNQDMENNQFDFHLDQMVSAQYIQKQEHLYCLTNLGKEYANRMDTGEITIIKQAKISAIIVPVKIGGKQKEYLIYTRLKQPFYGCQGFMSGKVKYGEQITEAAKRELKEETNLDGEPQIILIRHYRVFDSSTKILLEDKLMFFCLMVNPSGQLSAGEEGKFEWVKEKDLFNYVTNHFESSKSFKRDIKEISDYDGNVKFVEIDHFSSKF